MFSVQYNSGLLPNIIAGVRLKKMRGSGFRCETDQPAIHSFNQSFRIHSFLHSFNQSFRIQSCFEFTSAEASGNLGFPRGIGAPEVQLVTSKPFDVGT